MLNVTPWSTAQRQWSLSQDRALCVILINELVKISFSKVENTTH